jgi:dTDP-4-amino-4,6-dideoxygalactose transaminase
MAYLKTHGIGSLIHYPVPPHLAPAFVGLGYQTGDFPVAEAWAKTVLSLPMGPHLSEAEQRHVITSVRQFVAEQVPFAS